MSHELSRNVTDVARHALDTRYTRRTMLRNALLAGAAVPSLGALLAACGEDDDDDGEVEEVAAETDDDDDDEPVDDSDDDVDDDDDEPSDAPDDVQEGGIAVLPVSASPTMWDFSRANWVAIQATHHLYDKLLLADDEEEVQPHLATDWEVSEDGLEYSLELRDDVLFHDGTEFNAEAVKFNVERHIALPDSSYHAMYEGVSEVDIIDDTHVRLVRDSLRVNFLHELTLWGSIQISPTAVEEAGLDIDDLTEMRVGTGPFVFDSYEPDSHINYVRNENYWKGAPHLDGLQIRIIPEASVQVIELETGGVHALTSVQPRDIAAVEDAGATVMNTVAPGSSFLSINVSHDLTADRNIRRAIALSLDRDAMIEQVLEGFAEKARAGAASGSPYYHDDVEMIDFDPDLAGELLDESGWVLEDDGVRYRDGEPLTINILSTDQGNYALFNEIVQDQLRRVGFDAEIESYEWGAYLDQWRLNLGEWHVSYHSQGSQLYILAPVNASWEPDHFTNINRIRDSDDPQIMEVADELQALSEEMEQTLDFDDRRELARQVQETYQEHQLTIWLYHTETILAIRPELRDYVLTHHGRIIEFQEAWLEA